MTCWGLGPLFRILTGPGLAIISQNNDGVQTLGRKSPFFVWEGEETTTMRLSGRFFLRAEDPLYRPGWGVYRLK
jgi:hypothetical protein